MLFVMLISTLSNLFYTGDVVFETSFGTAIKRLMQYSLSFGLYFFYKDYFKNNSIDVSKILFIFIFYVALFAFFYKSFPLQYATYKYYLTPSDNHTMRYLANMVLYRFNYLWVDPNNVAYCIGGVSMWYLFNVKERMLKKTILLVLSTYIILCTQSIGGLITLVICVAIYFIYLLIKSFKFKIKPKTVFVCLLIIVGLLSIYKFSSISDYVEQNYLVNLRMRKNYYTNITMGGRGEDIVKSLNYLNPILIISGSGNEGFSYEIGHFYWIGMYGLISYLIFIWIIFRKQKQQSFERYIWIMPFFIGFTLNIAIGEFKWLAILFFLLAFSRWSMDNFEKESEVKDDA